MAIPPPILTARNLCLHYVARPGEYRRPALPPDDLAAMVRRELAVGRRPASLADYLRPQPHAPDRFTLSFDDAHRSVLTHALPLLGALDVPATLFVPTAYLGMSDEFLDCDELRALRDAGWIPGLPDGDFPRAGRVAKPGPHACYTGGEMPPEEHPPTARIPGNEVPATTLARVIARWQPEEIWLYGSRARGTHHPNSDWDLLVVVPDGTADWRLDLGEAWVALSDLRPPVEAYPVRRSEFEEGRHHLGTLAQIAVTEGRRVYAR